MIRLTKKAKSQIGYLWDNIKYPILILSTIWSVISMAIVIRYEWNGIMEKFPLYVIGMLEIYSFMGYIMFISMNWVYNAFEVTKEDWKLL